MPARLPLRLSSAVATVTGEGLPGPERVPEGSFELSITTHVLGEQVMLAGAHSRGISDEDAAETRDRTSTRYNLRTNPIILATVPDSVEIAGNRRAGVPDGPEGRHPGVAAVESYAITLTFSDGAATSIVWRVTVETPSGTAPGAAWRVTVPFSHHFASSSDEAAVAAGSRTQFGD
jgi:hypothetical protein